MAQILELEIPKPQALTQSQRGLSLYVVYSKACRLGISNMNWVSIPYISTWDLF